MAYNDYNNKPELKESYYRFGKKQYKKFLDIKLNRKTNVVSFLLGILFTAIIVFPFAFFLFKLIELYWFKSSTVLIFLCIAWGLLMLCNGLSSYITVRIVQAYETDMLEIQAIDSKAIFFSQTLNIGFGIAIFILLFIFWFLWLTNGVI